LIFKAASLTNWIPACAGMTVFFIIGISSQPLSRRNLERLQRKLLVYHVDRPLLNPIIGAHSPLGLVRTLFDRLNTLVGDRLSIELLLDDPVPETWLFNRSLVEMTLLNALRHAVAHARSTIRIEADLRDGLLAMGIHDDSLANPEESVAAEPAAGGDLELDLRVAGLVARLHQSQGRRGAVQQYRLYLNTGAVFSLLLP
jgi:hypothetical protein